MATGFDIYEEDYDDLRDYYDWLDLQYRREFGD